MEWPEPLPLVKILPNVILETKVTTVETIENIICLVDDDPNIVEYFEEILENLAVKNRVHTFDSPLEFLDKIDSQLSPNIVLMDFNMPELNGIQCVSHIHEKHPDCEVIFISGFLDKDNLLEMLEVGCFSCIQKPPSEQHILDVVFKAIASNNGKILNRAYQRTLNNVTELISEHDDQLEDAGRVAGFGGYELAGSSGLGREGNLHGVGFDRDVHVGVVDRKGQWLVIREA